MFQSPPVKGRGKEKFPLPLRERVRVRGIFGAKTNNDL